MDLCPQVTRLLSQVYLRLVDGRDIGWDRRAHTARVLRSLTVAARIAGR